MTTIRRAIFPDDLTAVTAIFREYVQSPTANLDFQDYEQEFAELPGKYAEPDGGVLLAVVEGRVVGCAALRRVEDGTCELKRVYVRPVARGMDLGRKLVEEMLRVAREAGYRRMCLDVLPEFVAAQRLYESLGFVTAEPVSFNPVPGTRFLALDL
ncbi:MULTISPECIES: GNAT family N-acetyltransferase [unclassified Acidovorax]|uniref:GNAT family N-acetyltransferase n=1 Tax=unclassified Acidovorax TaxID=2684926 RepID=UPI001C480D15|nr:MULTISPECIES: GNAT family N-acetyltransferase [unclassified Acidovorax]MBV7462362.1 GNAT family N-acetyltransferase [Acidovorax sp. sif0632]MBV7467545.1 GNAT family N-acetyltransferase [Acidovorax sp. sif0613]